jgi:O-antigen ligase
MIKMRGRSDTISGLSVQRPRAFVPKERFASLAVMSGLSVAIPALRAEPARVARALAVAVGSALLGVLLAIALRGESPQLPIVIAGGLGLLGVLALSLASYEAAVALGFLLLGVVAVEPAPPDGVLAVAIAIAIATRRFDVVRVPLAPIVLVVVFLALNVLSGMDAVDASRATRYFMITLYLGVLGIWLAAFVDSASRARLILRAYLIGAVTVGALASFALFAAFPGSELLTTADGLRAKGLFKDANVFGPFLIPAAFFVIEEILRPRLLGSGRLLKCVLLTILAIALLVAYSRAAWLNFVVGMFVMLVVYLLRRRGGRRAIALIVAGAALTGILAATIATTGSSHFLSERARLQTYDVERFGAQETGVSLARAHPLGIGPGQFELAAPLSAHSLYARTLAEQGFLGLAVILALLAVTLALACRNAFLGRHTWGIGSAALLAAWCGLLVNSAFVDTLHWRHLWVVASLIWAGAARSSWNLSEGRQLRWTHGPGS